MTRNIESPTITEEGLHEGETVQRHPAYAQIGASRVSGHASLYASDFAHNHYMTIRIATSSLRRALNHDWHFEGKQIIEVALSESQWATFVSSPNQGSGVPVTLTYLQGEMIAGLPDPEKRTEQFQAEVRDRLAASIASAEATIGKIDDLNLPKAKSAALKSSIESLLRDLHSNLPWVAKCFDEHMENTVEKAKAEVHGYMTNVIQRAGLDALTGGSLPLQITQEKAT